MDKGWTRLDNYIKNSPSLETIEKAIRQVFWTATGIFVTFVGHDFSLAF